MNHLHGLRKICKSFLFSVENALGLMKCRYQCLSAAAQTREFCYIASLFPQNTFPSLSVAFPVFVLIVGLILFNLFLFINLGV